MIRLLLLVVIIPLALAYDEHVSLYAVAAPMNALDPGYGAELSSTIGNRTVFSSGLQWSAPDDVDERKLQWRADIRLLYSSELNTQWYPAASIQWQATDGDLSAWLGAGFQREILPTLGLFSEIHWQPGSTDIQARLGLRFWFSRFSTLDVRVRSTQPQGAVYASGTVGSSALPLSEANEVDAIPDLHPDTVSTTNKQPAIAPQPFSLPLSADSVPNVAEDPATGWYVHLGLFMAEQSIVELLADSRLIDYREQISIWFDDDRQATRILLGPMSKPKASSVSNQLKQIGVENFLYFLR